MGFLVALMVTNLTSMWETRVWSLGWEDPLEAGMKTHSNIIAWRIPMDKGSMGSERVKHDWVTKHSTAHILLIITAYEN